MTSGLGMATLKMGTSAEMFGSSFVRLHDKTDCF